MQRFFCYFLSVFFLSLGLAGLALAEENPALTLKINSSSYPLSAVDVDSLFEEKITLAYQPNYLSEIENINFCQYTNTLACDLIFSFQDSQHIKKISTKNISDKKINDFLNDLERQVNKDPENAKLKYENERVSAFSLGSNGIKLNKEESFIKLREYLASAQPSGELVLPFTETKPEVSIDSIQNMGINSLIGEGRSNFKGSPKNRIYNINVATNRFNGVLIKPGEEFSFVKVLGEVDGEHGYLPELVIKKDKTEPEFGGGICQVSTTAFRAAIYSGLKITARRNHAYPVQYYNPQGMDSTVYIPRPDLRFINNTPGYILIQTKIEDMELVFDFYGTSDGRKINIIGPKITEKKPDGSMKATFTQQVFDKNNKLVFEDIFNSSYDSPNKYPHPGQETKLTSKPKDWSNKQWDEYKKANNLP
ncbi:MAG: VanW family protein [Candidatus Shapirobacteria bacterium]|nr:VanW family protein [Candidatus Shapirobacteria bacterium]